MRKIVDLSSKIDDFIPNFRTMKIGTRSSPLALLQAERVATTLRHHSVECEICPQKTVADRFLAKPLTDFGGKALFSRELDTALLENRVDICVHSLKDLESRLHPHLEIIATLKRDPASDMFVCNPQQKEKYQPTPDVCTPWHFLPLHAVVATCAPRRKAFLLQKRPDINVVPVRGNIERRLALLEKKNYHALVLSQASFLRSHRSMEQTQLIDFSDMLPAATQGVIAVVAVKESHQHHSTKMDKTSKKALENLQHTATFLTSTIEREILFTLGCNCHSPIAAFAHFQSSKEIKVQATILSYDGLQQYTVTKLFRSPRDFTRDPTKTEGQKIGRSVGFALLQRLPDSFISSLQLRPNSWAG